MVGKPADVEDRLFRVHGGDLTTRLGQRVDDRGRQAAEAGVVGGEEAGWSGTDDRDVHFEHARSSVRRLTPARTLRSTPARGSKHCDPVRLGRRLWTDSTAVRLRPPARTPASGARSRRRRTRTAATSPPTKPNRCPCQEICSSVGQQQHQLPAVEQPDDEGDGEVPQAALDDAAHEQQPQPAEDHPAGAEDQVVRRREEPHAEPAEHRDDQRSRRGTAGCRRRARTCPAGSAANCWRAGAPSRCARTERAGSRPARRSCGAGCRRARRAARACAGR